jgi:hypothetical protein
MSRDSLRESQYFWLRCAPKKVVRPRASPPVVVGEKWSGWVKAPAVWIPVNAFRPEWVATHCAVWYWSTSLGAHRTHPKSMRAGG